MGKTIIFVPSSAGISRSDEPTLVLDLPAHVTSGVYVAFDQYGEGFFVSCNYMGEEAGGEIEKNLGLDKKIKKSFIIDEGWVKQCKFLEEPKKLILHMFRERGNNDAGADMTDEQLMCYFSVIHQRSHTAKKGLEWSPMETWRCKQNPEILAKFMDKYREAGGSGSALQVVEWFNIDSFSVIVYDDVLYDDEDKYYEFTVGDEIMLWNVSKLIIRYGEITLLPGEVRNLGTKVSYKKENVNTLDAEHFCYH
jgi:hypothetical protein